MAAYGGTAHGFDAEFDAGTGGRFFANHIGSGLRRAQSDDLYRIWRFDDDRDVVLLVFGANVWGHGHFDLGGGGYSVGYWRVYRWTLVGGRQVLASDQSEKNLEWDHGRMALGRSFGSLSHAGNGRLVGRSGRDHRGFWRADG